MKSILRFFCYFVFCLTFFTELGCSLPEGIIAPSAEEVIEKAEELEVGMKQNEVRSILGTKVDMLGNSLVKLSRRGYQGGWGNHPGLMMRYDSCFSWSSGEEELKLHFLGDELAYILKLPAQDPKQRLRRWYFWINGKWESRNMFLVANIPEQLEEFFGMTQQEYAMQVFGPQGADIDDEPLFLGPPLLSAYK